MRPQSFEFLKKCGISQISFFGKVKDTNIHSERFLKFDTTHFVINRPMLEIKIIFLNFEKKLFFLK